MHSRSHGPHGEGAGAAFAWWKIGHPAANMDRQAARGLLPLGFTPHQARLGGKRAGIQTEDQVMGPLEQQSAVQVRGRRDLPCSG